MRDGLRERMEASCTLTGKGEAGQPFWSKMTRVRFGLCHQTPAPGQRASAAAAVPGARPSPVPFLCAAKPPPCRGPVALASCSPQAKAIMEKGRHQPKGKLDSGVNTYPRVLSSPCKPADTGGRAAGAPQGRVTNIALPKRGLSTAPSCPR